MLRPPSAPARWPALLFVLFSAVSLPGCSVLSNAFGSDPQASDSASEDAGAPTGQDAFSLQVNAPEALAEMLTKHMELQRFRQLPDLQANELSRLLGAADTNARDLLATEGYFSPDITIALKPQTEDAKAPPQTIEVTVVPGERTHIASVDLQVTGPQGDAKFTADVARRKAQLQRNWSLPEGQPFTQGAWSSAKSDGLRRLQTRRYPTARIESSRAEIDADTAKAQLQAHFETGPAYRFGPLEIRGSQRYDPTGAARIARLPVGDDYSETKLLDAQQRLAASGYYDAVFLSLQTDGVDPQHAPVMAQVREAPLQKFVFGVGFSTDNGPRLSMDHIHNRLPGLGWRAVSKVSLDRDNQLLSTEWTDLPNDNGWRWFTGGELKLENIGSYDVTSAKLRAGRNKTSDHIDRSYFLQYDTASSRGAEAPPPSASAISVNYGWTGRYFNNNTAPTRGYGLAAEAGVGTTLRPERDLFIRTLLRWHSFVSLGRVDMGENISRNSRLALRVEGGAVLARKGADIPVTQLFLTGGDTTVRGYGYRAIGARTDSNTVYGGRYMALGSAEWQRPITLRGNRTDFESAVFIDAGAVADSWGEMHTRVGVGAGLRWRSPVGPLQADIAYGVQPKQLRLHLRLGYTF